MAEETIRYRVEIDEPSLQSELSRARVAITNVLQGAMATGQYAVNSIHADLQTARQTLSGPANVASPAMELGFLGSTMAMMGRSTPPNMLSSDFNRMAQEEMEGRITRSVEGIGREAVPVAGGLAGVFAMSGRGPLAALAGGAAGYLGSRMASSGVFNDLATSNDAESILKVTGAPHPMMKFSEGDRRGLVGGLMSDLASDVRFGVGELGTMLAGGDAVGAFSGATSVEDFRTKFRSMLEQIKSITRVFQQSTQEAFTTLSQFSQLGASPESMNGRISDVLAGSRMSGMAPGQVLDLGMAGAQYAKAHGMPMAEGFDMMTRNTMLASVAEASLTLDPGVMRQLGGVQGVAALTSKIGSLGAGFPGMQTMLAGLSNDSMTGLDMGKLNRFVSGDLSGAMDRMADPAQRLRFASNVDLIQNQLATSGLGGQALFSIARAQADISGGSATDIFGGMMREMGMNPMERQAAIAMTQQGPMLNFMVDRQRRASAQELEMERRIEESRFSSQVGAGYERFTTNVSRVVGEPIRRFSEGVAGVTDKILSFPGKALDWLDIQMGRLIFGGKDLSGQDSLRTMNSSALDSARGDLQNSIRTVSSRVDFGNIQFAVKLSGDERDALEEIAIGTWSDEIKKLTDEQDPVKRSEMRDELKQKITGWAKSNFGHLDGADSASVTAFADQLVGIERLAMSNDNIYRGLDAVVKNSTAVQMRQYLGDEMPALLAMAATRPEDQDRLIGIAEEVAAGFKGRPDLASFQALKTLGDKAAPMLSGGSKIRERLDVAKMLMAGGALSSSDLTISGGELDAVRKQNLSSVQESFVGDLERAARASKGHELTADQLFRAIGMGLGGQSPSQTPGPGAGLDSSKWDQTAMILDKLNGSVTNLNAAATQLLQSAQDQNKRMAGKN